MLDGIPASLLGALGPAALASLAVLLVMVGKLIPRSTHDAIVAGKDDQIAYLREALALEAERGRLQGEANAELLEHARAVDQFIRALPQRGAVS